MLYLNLTVLNTFNRKVLEIYKQGSTNFMKWIISKMPSKKEGEILMTLAHAQYINIHYVINF